MEKQPNIGADRLITTKELSEILKVSTTVSVGPHRQTWTQNSNPQENLLVRAAGYNLTECFVLPPQVASLPRTSKRSHNEELSDNTFGSTGRRPRV